MRKIRLSDNDVELFDIEISPMEFVFYQKHKDAFRTMWREQGKPFWMRFVITFRSFTVKYGVIKQMNIDSLKFENLIDQAFIFMHEQYVDGKENMAKNFIEDVARLAQNQDKFPALDSKSFARDPFYLRETRELFRRFFGMPDQKSSYLKVYILSPIYMRFGGAVCRCLVRWLEAPPHDDPSDTSYWLAPAADHPALDKKKKCAREIVMCSICVNECGTKFFNETIYGARSGPKSLPYWNLGDPRFNDPDNPLYAPSSDLNSDWRDSLSVEMFREFLHYSKFKYGTDDDKCKECFSLNLTADKPPPPSRSEKKKRRKKKKDAKNDVQTKDMEEFEHLVIDMDLAGDNDPSDEALMKKVISSEKYKGAKTPADVIQQMLNDNPNFKPMLEANLSMDNEPISDLKPATAKSAETAPKATKSQQPGNERKDIFSKSARVTDDYKCGILASDAGAANKNVVGGFKVVRINDEKAGMYEVNITVTTLKGDGVVGNKRSHPARETTIQYPLSREILLAKIAGLPQRLEWWEGLGWCAAVLDYTDEETSSVDKPTNFTVKLSDCDEDTLKRTMIQILYYVSKRKSRPSRGWCLDVDDIVACILPDESPDQQGLTICVMRGFRFEQRLTDLEKQSLLKPHPSTNEIIMSLKDGMAAHILKEEGGEEKLRKLLKSFGGTWQHSKGQMACKNGTTSPVQVQTRGPQSSADAEIFSSELWEKTIQDPAKFDELFVMVEAGKEEELARHGMVKIEMEEFMKVNRPTMFLCRHECKDCSCFKPEAETFFDQYIEKCKKDKVGAAHVAQILDPAPTLPTTKVNVIPLPPPPSRLQADRPQPKAHKSKASKVKLVQPVRHTEPKLSQSSTEAKPKTLPKDNGGGATLKYGGNSVKGAAPPAVEIMSRKVETSTNFPFTERKVQIDARLPAQGQTSSPEQMAPIPGMTSTINFTINSGQSISIKLDAYMNEDKLKELEKRNKEIKTLEAFTDCVQAESDAAQTPGPPGQYVTEKLLEAVAANLPPDLQEMMKCEVQSTPAPPVNNVNVSTASESKNQKPATKEVNRSNKKDLMAELTRVAKEVTNSVISGDHGNSKPATVAKARNGSKDGKKKSKGRVEERESQKVILKQCGNCSKEEPTRKAFKKCQKCKDEGVTDVHYYCNRDCQVDDWKKRHRTQHKDGSLL